MPTKVLEPTAEAVTRATEVIRAGGLVAFPTETVYGLGADALSPTAVARIFEAKERPRGNPLIVHVTDVTALDQVAAQVPDRAREVLARFWPGPLTLVLERAPAVPLITTGGLDTVAVRAPAHPVAQALIQAVGRPLAAPSANRSGRPSPTRAQPGRRRHLGWPRVHGARHDHGASHAAPAGRRHPGAPRSPPGACEAGHQRRRGHGPVARPSLPPLRAPGQGRPHRGGHARQCQ